MDENQLRTALESDPMVKFGGVYACDEIPNTLLSEHFYIINTAPSRHPGEHWISVYAGHEVECFDSLAKKQTVDQFKDIIQGLHYTNAVAVQHPLSISCGEYCLFYVYLRCRGISLDCIINVLSGWDNEQFVLDFVRNRYSV